MLNKRNFSKLIISFVKDKLTKRINAVKVLVVLLLLGYLVGLFRKGIKDTPFYVDEEAWLTRTSLYQEFIHGNMWDRGIWNQFITYDQPPLMAYLTGFSFSRWPVSKVTAPEAVETAKTCCLTESMSVNGQTISCRSTKYWNVYLYGRKFSEFPECMKIIVPFVLRNRLISAVFTFLTIILIFFFGWQLAGYWAGLAASVFLVSNWVLFHQMFWGLADSLLMFFCVLTILLGMFAGNLIKNSPQGYYKCCIFIGLFAGLGLSTKLNGGFSLVIVIIGLLVTVIKNRLPAIRLALGLSIAGTVSSLIFIFLNPYLYTNPINNTVAMFNHRISQNKIFQYESPELALTTVPQRALAIKRNLFLLGKYGDYSSWESLWLFIGGLILVIYKSANEEGYLWLLLTVIGWLIYLLLFLPLNWSRYYLPAVPWISVVQANTIAFLAKNCWKKMMWLR